MAEAAAETLCALGCCEVTLHHHGLARRRRFAHLGKRRIYPTQGLRTLCWGRGLSLPDFQSRHGLDQSRIEAHAQSSLVATTEMRQPLAAVSSALTPVPLQLLLQVAVHAEAAGPTQQAVHLYVHSVAAPPPSEPPRVAAPPPAEPPPLSTSCVAQKVMWVRCKRCTKWWPYCEDSPLPEQCPDLCGAVRAVSYEHGICFGWA